MTDFEERRIDRRSARGRATTRLRRPGWPTRPARARSRRRRTALARRPPPWSPWSAVVGGVALLGSGGEDAAPRPSRRRRPAARRTDRRASRPGTTSRSRSRPRWGYGKLSTWCIDGIPSPATPVVERPGGVVRGRSCAPRQRLRRPVPPTGRRAEPRGLRARGRSTSPVSERLPRRVVARATDAAGATSVLVVAPTRAGDRAGARRRSPRSATTTSTATAACPACGWPGCRSRRTGSAVPLLLGRVAGAERAADRPGRERRGGGARCGSRLTEPSPCPSICRDVRGGDQCEM